MSALRAVSLLILLPVFAGCQSLPWSQAPSAPPTGRLQGEVTRSDGALLLHTCEGTRAVELLDAGATGLPDDTLALLDASALPLFADVRGQLRSPSGGRQQLQVSQVYRLAPARNGCGAGDFDTLVVHAVGHAPDWRVQINPEGLLLERPGHEPLAVPYLEEQLPAGQSSFSSEANGQRLDLWVAPQRCVDRATGAVSHLTAELRLDGQTLRGCAYAGGARDQ